MMVLGMAVVVVVVDMRSIDDIVDIVVDMVDTADMAGILGMDCTADMTDVVAHTRVDWVQSALLMDLVLGQHRR